jgi:hypothetical protein
VGDALQKRKVDVGVEPLRLEAGEPVGDGLKLLADRLKIIQALPESEVLEIIGAELVPQEYGELLILLIDVMAMLDLVDDGRELAGDLAV